MTPFPLCPVPDVWWDLPGELPVCPLKAGKKVPGNDKSGCDGGGCYDAGWWW